MNKMLLKLLLGCIITVMLTSSVLASKMFFPFQLTPTKPYAPVQQQQFIAPQFIKQQFQVIDQEELKQVAKEMLNCLTMDGAFDQRIHATGPTLRQHMIKSHIIFNNIIPQQGDKNFHKSIIMSKDKHGDDVILMLTEIIKETIEKQRALEVSYFIASGERYLRIQVPAPEVVFYQKGRQIQNGYLNFCLTQGWITDPSGDHSKGRWTYNLTPNTVFMSEQIPTYQHPGSVIGLNAASIQNYKKVEKRLVFENYIVDQDKIKVIGASGQQAMLLDFFQAKAANQLTQPKEAEKIEIEIEIEEEEESREDSEVKKFLELELELEPKLAIQEFEKAPECIVDKITYPNGDIYEGKYINGKRHGKGKMTYADGSIYEGEWKNDLKDGFGYAEFLDTEKQKITYRGYFKGGQMHRGEKKSKMTCSNGDVYKGDWKNGRLEKGVIEYPNNGGQYEGRLRNGKPHKKGKMTYPNGDTYEGEWQNGKPHNQGIRRSQTGVVLKEGLFFNGQFIPDMQRQQKNRWCASYLLILPKINEENLRAEVMHYIQTTQIHDEACIYAYDQALDVMFCVYSQNAAISAIDSLGARGEYSLKELIKTFKAGKLSPLNIQLIMRNSYVKSDNINTLPQFEQTIKKIKPEQLKIILEDENLDDDMLFRIAAKCRFSFNYEILAAIIAHKNVGPLTLMSLVANTNNSDIFVLIAQQYIEANYGGIAIVMQMLNNNKFRSFDTYFGAIEAVVAKHATNDVFLNSLVTCMFDCYGQECGSNQIRIIAPMLYAIASNAQVSAQTLKFIASKCLSLSQCMFKFETLKCVFKSGKIQTNDSEANEIAVQVAKRFSGDGSADDLIIAIATKYRDHPDVLVKIATTTNSDSMLQAINAVNQGPEILKLIKQKQQLANMPIIMEQIWDYRILPLKPANKFIGATGSIYQGTKHNGLPDGWGTMIYCASGENYIGAWKNGKRHGLGQLILQDGSSYEALWNDDCMQFTAETKFTDVQFGNQCQGEWLDGKLQGKGSCTFKLGITKTGEFLDGKFIADPGVSQWCDSYLLQLPSASFASDALLREAIQNYIQETGILDEACVYVYNDNGTVLCIYIQQAQIKTIETLLARPNYNLEDIIKGIKLAGNKLSYSDINEILRSSYSKAYAPDMLRLDAEVKTARRNKFQELIENPDLSDYALRLLAQKCHDNNRLMAIATHKNASALTCMYIAQNTECLDVLAVIAQQHIKASYSGLAILMSMLKNSEIMKKESCLPIFEILAAQHVLNDYFIHNFITRMFNDRDPEMTFDERIRSVLYSIARINMISANTLKFVAQRYLTLKYNSFESVIFKCILENEKIQPRDQEVIEIVINIAGRIPDNTNNVRTKELITAIVNKYRNHPDVLEKIAAATNSVAMKEAIQQLKDQVRAK